MASNDIPWDESLLKVGAFWKHKIFLTSLKLDIYTHLATASKTCLELARAVHARPRTLEVFLNALCALGLLRKVDGRYMNTEQGQRLLVSSSLDYVGHQLLVDDASWERWTQLETTVRTGRRPRKEQIFIEDSWATENLITGLHRDAMHIAPALAERLDLTGTRRLLDLGGGAGTYSIFFCLTYPKLQAVVYDLPHTLRVTRRTIKEFGLEKRVRTVEGDFRKGPIPGRYDTLFLSNVLPGQTPSQNRRLFSRLHGCLADNGAIVIRDVVLDESGTRPVWGAVFSVNMLLEGSGGRCYTFPEISSWLTAAGFTGIEEVLPHELLIARKDSRDHVW